MSDIYIIECPYCKHELELSKEWIEQYDRVYCGNCTQIFPLEEGCFINDDDTYEEF